MKNNINKEKAYKIIAMVLSVVMVLGSLLWIAEKGSSAAESNAEDTTETQEAIEKEYPDLLASHCQDGEVSKEEVIYVAMDADGNIQDTSVTEWLHNGTGAESINDVSTLNDIENTSNDKPFTRDGNSVVWEADGSDIKYKGTIDKELPVSVKVRYYLDGKSISAGDIAGKAGNVTIRFDYTINTEATSNGYVFKTPYTMASGVILDDEHFTDVKVNDGKVIDDGNKCICLGLAFPGLADNLDIHSTEFDIPETVMISAYTDRFEIDGTYTVALTGMLSDIGFDGSESLESKIEQLQDGMEKLGDASDKLVKGADQLTDGAYELAEGAGKISDGAASAAAGADQLASGLDKISDKSGELNGGAREVFNTLLSEANKQIAAAGLSAPELTIDNYSSVLDSLIDSLSEENARALAEQTARNTVTATVESQRDLIRQGVENAVRKQVTEAVLAAAGLSMTADEYDSAVAAGQVSEDIQAQVSAGVSTQMSAMQGTIDEKTEAQIQSIIEENVNSEQVQAQISEGVQRAAGGKASLKALKQQLDSYNTFYNGILSYTAGVDQANSGAMQILNGTYAVKNGSGELANGSSRLKDGTGQLNSGAIQLKDGSAALKDGTGQLKQDSEKLAAGTGELNAGAVKLSDGSGELFSGIDTLHSNIPSLISGITQLKDGSMRLNDGMKQFKEEGVDKLKKAADGDIKSLVERIKAISKVSKGYQSYSGLSDGAQGQVDFIFKTAGIENKD